MSTRIYVLISQAYLHNHHFWNIQKLKSNVIFQVNNTKYINLVLYMNFVVVEN